MSENTDTTITILANGQSRKVQAASTVVDLLQELQVTPTHVVVQLDGMIVPRAELGRAVLQEGSKLEIVTLVGGG